MEEWRKEFKKVCWKESYDREGRKEERKEKEMKRAKGREGVSKR